MSIQFVVAGKTQPESC